MNLDDLTRLGMLLETASAVVALEDVIGIENGNGVVAMRHDVDDDLYAAMVFAAWERERGYRSTYFLLHSARYWQDTLALAAAIDFIAGACRHEIGFHVDAIALALSHVDDDPATIAAQAIERLRRFGYPVHGVVAHGSHVCYEAEPKPNGKPIAFVNDELFLECARPDMGDPQRTLRYHSRRLALQPISMTDLGLDYEANRLPRGGYVSESGGTWSDPELGMPGSGALHMLCHPQHWRPALEQALS